MTPQELLAAWHEQQTAFIEHRDLRTRTIIDVLKARYVDAPITVLDLACGPGSLGAEILREMPSATIIGVDRDPVLLRLGTETNQFGERLRFIDADLTDSHWVEQLLTTDFDAVISATALHWFEPDQLSRLYLDVTRVVKPGAIFMNADHLLYDAHHNPTLATLSETIREDFRTRTVSTGVLTWEAWWEAAVQMPGWEKETELWHQRWADKSPTVKVDTAYHLAALRSAGCTETGHLYQWLDDYLIYGIWPTN
ncbi:Methyltransferase [Corynebacterium ulcerans]|uniref:class I SAM-dependent methyltransferase n=1 Tax=Corynebacterium ulcerans TaxID=65058 RepID=UPI0005211B96|nr:class I SAM-dependent methyltransferase [Corynebacterium ulcerans]AIU29696.1 Methyltransferase [Corynebacterium ulcerans]